jgi:RAD51-like protein 3
MPQRFQPFLFCRRSSLVLRYFLTQAPLAALERLQVSLAFELEVARGILEELNQLGNVKFITTVFYTGH